MYTILVTEANELTVTVKERIMQRSNLVDNLHFLTDPTYKDVDMTDFAVTLEYTLPVSKEYHTDTLVLSDDLYKDMLEYTLPLSTSLTKEGGDVEMQLTFSKVEMDEDGNTTQYVRKTSVGTLHIVPIAAWSDMVPDSALTAIDQRIIKLQALLEAYGDTLDAYLDGKADGISYEDYIISLLSGDTVLGQANLSDLHDECDCEDGVVSEGMEVVLF